MLKFSPCIEMIFKNVDFYERFAAAKNAGVDAVEFWGFAGREKSKLKEAKDSAGITISSVCIDTTIPEIAEKYNLQKLLYRESVNEFLEALKESIVFANELGIKKLIATTGQARNDITHYEQHANVVYALKQAAPIIEDSGLMIILEPLNIIKDHKGYFLSSTYEAMAIIDEVGSENIKLLFDIYHQQLTDGNIIPNILKYSALIGHYHVADNPGRNQPGTGELNYRNIFAAIEKTGYNGFVGLEYTPTIDSAESIKNTMELLSHN